MTDIEILQAKLAHARNVLDGIRTVTARRTDAEILPWVQSECDKALAFLEEPQVDMAAWTFTFPTAEIADSFGGYMSDGGGEYGFFDVPEGKDASFDYDFKRRVCNVTVVPEEADWDNREGDDAPTT